MVTEVKPPLPWLRLKVECDYLVVEEADWLHMLATPSPALDDRLTRYCEEQLCELRYLDPGEIVDALQHIYGKDRVRGVVDAEPLVINLGEASFVRSGAYFLWLQLGDTQYLIKFHGEHRPAGPDCYRIRASTSESAALDHGNADGNCDAGHQVEVNALGSLWVDDVQLAARQHEFIDETDQVFVCPFPMCGKRVDLYLKA